MTSREAGGFQQQHLALWQMVRPSGSQLGFPPDVSHASSVCEPLIPRLRLIYSCIHTTSPYTFPLLGLTQFKATITAAPHMLILYWTRAH